MDSNSTNSPLSSKNATPGATTLAAGSGGGGGNANLLSRDLLTRGFNSFDDSNLSGYMIDEKELLDLERINSPDLAGLSSYTTGVHGGAQGPAFGSSSARPINGGNSFNTTPGYPVASGVGATGLPFGTTPPIPESTSPFDEFMLNNAAIRQPGSTSTQHAMWSERHKRAQAATSNSAYTPNQVAQYGMTQISSPPPSDALRSPPQLPLRFLHDYGVHSNTSSPVGSLGSDAFGLSPSTKPPLGSGKLAGAMAHSLDDNQNLLLAEQRRRRRRESHNAVERRRRDNINEKIQELATLVPNSLLYASDPLASPTGPGSATSNLTKDGKPNKGTILSRSVDYIRNLQAVIDEQNRKELEMRDLVQDMQRKLGIEVTVFGATSAELALAKIRGISTEGLEGLDENTLEGFNNDGTQGLLNEDMLSPEGNGYGAPQGYDIYTP